jgi:GNAT superfamily N-acetyltransferase
VSDFSASAPFVCRPMTPDDIAAAQRLSAAIGWPHRREDWRFSLRTGTGFAVELDGTLAGTVVCWKFGEQHGTLGMLMVAPTHRRKGIGRALLQRVLDELGERDITLYATEAGQPLCAAYGFTARGKLDQLQGAAFRPPLVELPSGERLRPLGARDAAQLVQLATRASGLDRSHVLPPLFDHADGIALDRDGELLGFSLFRRFGRGFIIGPVIAADTAEAVRAKALIRHWLALNEGALIRIDVPDGHGLREWLAGLGLVRTETVVKMERVNPGANTSRSSSAEDAHVHQFAVITQSLT